MTHRVGDLELGGEEEVEPHWAWQRAGWAALALALAAAVLGLFGGGPLARGAARSDDGALALKYERFTRFQSAAELRVTASGAATTGGELRLLVDREYFRSADLEHVTPEPKATRATARDLEFTFDVAGGEPAEVSFQFRPSSPRITELAVRLPDRPPLRVRQVIYP